MLLSNIKSLHSKVTPLFRKFSTQTASYYNRNSSLNASEQPIKPFSPAKFSFAPNTDQFPSTNSEVTKYPRFPFQDENTNDSLILSSESISKSSFDENTASLLQEEIDPSDIEIRQDGFLYLPEIKYRSILLRAFGPGGWTLIPKGGHTINNDFISREYWLLCHGKFISSARGFGMIRNEISDAVEAAKSNALVRCCKDLGIAKELWNPEYVKKWKDAFATSFSSTDGKRTLWKKVSSPENA